MSLADNTFDYLKPTKEQIEIMSAAREASKVYMQALDQCLPEGPDKTYVMRCLRTTAMWANIAITRHADATPRV